MIAALLLTLATSSSPDLPGPWKGTLTCPGGEIPFGLEFEKSEEGDLAAILVNGPERLRFDRIEALEGIVPRYRVHLDPYGSWIDFSIASDGLHGEWVRYRRKDEYTRLPFRAIKGAAPRFGFAKPGKGEAFEGRFKVDFSKADDHSVGLFDVDDQGRVTGTFLTTLGDYRFLAGETDGDKLALSVFDGAHAFLFMAQRQKDGSLSGHFWSRDTWHETWTAVKSDDAELPDPFGLTEWTGAVPLEDLSFPDLTGKERSLGEFEGKVRLIVVFGSWCPNCYDQTRYLVELSKRYGDRGLSILGLAFEFGDDQERQTEVLKRYVDLHGITYPVLLAGTSDKAEASKRFPVIDKVRSYPTVLFLDEGGEVLAINTGFSGPATGEAHERLRERFEAVIEAGLGTR